MESQPEEVVRVILDHDDQGRHEQNCKRVENKTVHK